MNRPPLGMNGPRSSALLALAVFAVLSPTLARTPQSGDGAEVVMTALRGGVLHPPGFPLQAWLDRGIAALAGTHTAFAIAAFGLAAHAAAAFCVSETLRLLGVALAARLLAVAAFALFPPLWGLAVEPEVFSPAHLLLAAAILVAVRSASDEARVGPALAAGLTGGLGLASHPVFLAAAPALIAAGARATRAGPRRGARVSSFFAALVLPPVALYLSLPLLRTASVWPDWGALRGVADIARHALRADYGGLSFSAAGGEETRSGLAVWAAAVGTTWNAALALAIFGALRLSRRRDARRAAVAILGALAAGLAILAAGRLPVQSYSLAYLGKLGGPATLAVALLIGLGTQEIAARMKGSLARRALTGGAAAVALAWLVIGWPEADASRDRTLELHQLGVAGELPRGAVYATEGDVELFMGVADSSGRRFPIQDPWSAPEWYLREVAPRIDPGVSLDASRMSRWEEFHAAMLAQGRAIASTSRTLATAGGHAAELRGLIYVATPGRDEDWTAETVRAALRLVPLAGRLPDLPLRGHELSRFYQLRFARAFAGASLALQALAAPAAAARANEAAEAIRLGRPAAERSRALEAFALTARRAGY